MIWPFSMAFIEGLGMLAVRCELWRDFRHFRAGRVLSLVDAGQRRPSRPAALCAMEIDNALMRTHPGSNMPPAAI